MFGNLINKAMSMTSKLPAFAKSVIQKDVQVYDASKNSVTIAGLEMTGWEHAHISDIEVTKEYLGVDPNEFALVKQVYIRKLSISFLPTENSIKKLEELSSICLSWGKFFVISITENGQWLADYHAQFSTVGGVRMQQEGENVTFEFFLKPISTRSRESLMVTNNTPVADEQPPSGDIIVTPLPLPTQ